MTGVTARFGRKTLAGIPRGIWALGFVSMFMDISSEMIHALLPLYLVTVLGASTLTVGIIEGIAEATAAIVKIFSGAVSDWIGNRKFLAAFGYGLAAFTKPVFPLAPSIAWLIGARFVDRLGKGIRGAPRDALVADLAPAELRGASFGLRQSLDTVGAFIGPFAAIVLMLATANSFRTVFWFAVIPAFISLALILGFVREPHRQSDRKARFPLHRDELVKLPLAFWLVILVATIFTLARFSEAFLILKSQAVGLPIALAPAIMVLMNIVYSLAAYPAGVLADGKGGRDRVMMVGLLFLLGADALLALSTGILGAGIGVIFWGLHMGFTQGLLATLIADVAPAELRGTAFGIFNLITGLALLLASLVAGWLWDIWGPQATFLAGAGLSLLALLSYIAVRPRLNAASGAGAAAAQ